MNSIMWNRCFAIFDPEIETAQLASYFLVSKWAKGTALNAKQVKEVTAIKKTREEVLAEIREADEKRHALATELLKNIKTRKTAISNKLEWFKNEEPDLVYRFYHQSFKVFIMVELIRNATELFHEIAPESTDINIWYLDIENDALNRKFDPERTNINWSEATLPLTQAFWHTKYFLEQMAGAAESLEEAPRVLPSGWAAVLDLYDLR